MAPRVGERLRMADPATRKAATTKSSANENGQKRSEGSGFKWIGKRSARLRPPEPLNRRG